jgi:hypothetical protein
MEVSGAIFGRYKNVYPELKYPAVLCSVFPPGIFPCLQTGREYTVGTVVGMWQGCKRQSDRKLVSGWSKVAHRAEVVAARSPPPALHPLLLQPSCCFSTCASHRHRYSFFVPSSRSFQRATERQSSTKIGTNKIPDLFDHHRRGNVSECSLSIATVAANWLVLTESVHLSGISYTPVL